MEFSFFTCKELLLAIIKTYEIQEILALTNSFNRIGFDYVILVKIATAAVATARMKGTRSQIADALSNAWIDAGLLRIYRHAPECRVKKIVGCRRCDKSQSSVCVDDDARGNGL